MLRGLGAEVREVRVPADLDGLDGLVMPGGESTTMDKLARAFELFEPLQKRIADGMPVFGTCAGMIMLANEITGGIDGQETLGGLDVTVRRNAFGRQVASFEADVDLEGEPVPVRGVFIRAPRIVDAGPAVEVLGRLGGEPVLVRGGRVLAASFHPELTDDTRIHQCFLELVREEEHVRA